MKAKTIIAAACASLVLGTFATIPTVSQAQDLGDVFEGAIVGGVIGGVVGGNKGARAGAAVGAIGGYIDGADRDDYWD